MTIRLIDSIGLAAKKPNQQTRLAYLRGFRTICSLLKYKIDPATYFVDALILISTPAGKLNLFSASIVLAVAWTISIKRLCVLISYCWRAFLFTKGPDKTVYRSILVGSGIGP